MVYQWPLWLWGPALEREPLILKYIDEAVFTPRNISCVTVKAQWNAERTGIPGPISLTRVANES